MAKHSITINGKKLSWESIPVKRKKKKKKKKKKILEPDYTNFLKEHPYFSLDTPVIIDEPDKEWFKEQYEKDFKQMIKAVGFIDIRK
jgi:hypothetical protein